MHRLATRITAPRWSGAVALLALVAAGLLIGLVGQVDRPSNAADDVPTGSDSAAAIALEQRLPQADSTTALVLITRSAGKLSPAEVTDLARLVHQLPGAADAPLTVSRDRSAALGIVAIPTDTTEVSDRVQAIRDALARDLPSGVTAQVTGPAGIQADLAAVFDGANTRLLLATTLVVAFLLVITYRSPVLWLIPLTVVGVADQLAGVLATRAMDVFGLAWDGSTTGILSVLVFGAGTDYALLLISRYRDELRRYDDRRDAMAHALTRTTEAVVASAVTVVAGVLTLLLSLFPTTRALGVACAVGIVTAAVFALVVLPAALVVFGRWVFWPRVPRPGQSPLGDAPTPWRRIGNTVARRPLAYAGAAVVVLALGAAFLPGVRTGLSQSDQFLDKPESIAGAERLAQSFPAGASDPTQVVTSADPGRVRDQIAGVEGVAQVRESGSGGGVTAFDVVLDAAPSSPAAARAVDALRGAVSSVPGTHVGGPEAEAVDEASATSRDRLLIFPIVLALVLVALGLLLRAVVAPLLLVATVLATYVASLGLSWLVFTHVLDFGALDSSAPLFAFVFLVALGVDYNIFLVTRAREESREHGTSEGMLRGLASTGGVITSAGILLAAVFAVLGVLPLVVLAQLGVIVGVGVLLDTLLVRTVLVPALALLLGDRFWWPGAGSARS
jgi:RND superfamily putative drug exporter